jgi:hypothetical protein
MTRRYLFDTGIAQDFQEDRGDVRARAIDHRKQVHRIGICVPVLGELAGLQQIPARLQRITNRTAVD